MILIIEPISNKPIYATVWYGTGDVFLKDLSNKRYELPTEGLVTFREAASGLNQTMEASAFRDWIYAYHLEAWVSVLSGKPIE